MGKSIPRVIHQVYASRKLPHVIEENISKLKQLNPGWRYEFYDDDDMCDYIRAAYGADVLADYNRINAKYGAARADFFRYLLIYKEGGVYLDIKASLQASLDERLQKNDTYLLSRWPAKGSGRDFAGWGAHRRLRSVGGEEFQQWYIAAAAGHPFLRHVIDNVRANIRHYNPLRHGTGREGVMWVTGPIVYTRSIVPLLPHHHHRIVDAHADLGLIYSIFGTSESRPHKSLFKFHYTSLTEPVAALSGARRYLWALATPMYVHIVLPLRRISAAISRRLASKAKPDNKAPALDIKNRGP